MTRQHQLLLRMFLANWANSCEKARREVRYAMTPLREAMRETFEWLDQTANIVEA